MIRYICDLCQTEIDPRHESSYVVQMELYPAASTEEFRIDDDRDHLADFNEVLRRFDEFDDEGVLLGSDNYRKKRFDLCSDCAKRFLQDPLGRRASQSLELSKP
ncbi:MAG: hypothetical protein IT425_05865 [Pirellulales bacterium]|nr:hypothetical protein [Pirellulales bacterium]